MTGQTTCIIGNMNMANGKLLWLGIFLIEYKRLGLVLTIFASATMLMRSQRWIRHRNELTVKA